MKRTDFEKRILELLVEAKLLTAEQQEIVLEAQDISSVQTVGEIAVQKKFISQKSLNAMLKAQEAEKIAQFGEGKDSRIPLVKKDGVVVGFKTDERAFKRNYIDNETDRALLSFQVAEHLCALLRGAVQIKPLLAQHEKIKNVSSALKVLGGIAYLEAAWDLTETNPALATELRGFGDRLINGAAIEKGPSLLALHDGINMAADALPYDQQEIFFALVKKRENQIDMGGNNSLTLNDISEIRDLINSAKPNPQADKDEIKF